MSTERAPELHPWLHGAPSLDTQKAHALHKLHSDLRVLTELIERIKTCTGLREPDKYGDHYTPDRHLQLVGEGRYRDALALIATRGQS